VENDSVWIQYGIYRLCIAQILETEAYQISAYVPK